MNESTGYLIHQVNKLMKLKFDKELELNDSQIKVLEEILIQNNIEKDDMKLSLKDFMRIFKK